MDKSLINVGSNQNGITGVLTINPSGSLNGAPNWDIDIRSAGTLNLCGTLTAKNVIFSNGSVVNVCPTGILNISGNFENKNNSNSVTINGTMTVGGSFINGNGGVISGTGSISITNGPITNTGNTFGCLGTAPCGGLIPCTFSSPCSPLPIELLSFTAKAQNKSVILNWITVTETNNDYFSIERSKEGTEFEEIIIVDGAGTSNLQLSYVAKDVAPYTGLSYYRLKQTDFDGKFSYSQIVPVNINTGVIFKIIPNPSDGKTLNLVFHSDSEELLMVECTSVVGKKVLMIDKFNNPKDVFLNLAELTRFTSGGYVVRVTTNLNVYAEKFILLTR